jgi:hypothetical protein
MRFTSKAKPGLSCGMIFLLAAAADAHDVTFVRY